MVQSYEEGARLLKVCRQRIDAARQRVELITADLDGNGKAVLSTFEQRPSSRKPSQPRAQLRHAAPPPSLPLTMTAMRSDFSDMPPIQSPQDLKALPVEQLPELAEQLAARSLKRSQTGGHLGPNLGVVELTLAMHHVLRRRRTSSCGTWRIKLMCTRC